MGGLNVDRDDNQASANLIYLMVKVRTQVKMNVWVRQYVGSYSNLKKKCQRILLKVKPERYLVTNRQNLC